MNSVPTLLVDNSNTRTKFTLLRGGDFDRHPACLPTAELSPSSIRHLLAARGWSYARTLLCSVVPSAADIIAEAVGGDVHRLSAASPLPLAFDYPKPQTLGADRIANALAVASSASLPCVAVDIGTATTFDVVVPGEGGARFIGGVIAPGLGSMGQYLARNTALLPALEPGKPAHAIGRSTEEALQSGSCHGYCGLVRGILQALAAELGEEPTVIATGGDAALLSRWMPGFAEVRPLLTLEGLALAAESLPSCSFFGRR